MENAGEQPRRTSRVRKTPTKFSQDFDTLDNSPVCDLVYVLLNAVASCFAADTWLIHS